MNPQLVIFGSGLLAGAMNALAGGGTFVALPALISVGVPSVQANASSTAGLFPGTAASAWAYRDGLAPIGAVSLRSLSFVTVLGGAIGAWLLLSTPSAVLAIQLAIGGYGGALLGRCAAPRVIRAGTLLIASGITLLFFARTYVKLSPVHPFK